MTQPTTNVAGLFLHYARLDKKRTSSGLTPRERNIFEGLRHRLNSQLSPGVPQDLLDRRASIRLPTSLPCSVRSDVGVRRGTILNLSRAGMLLEITDPPSVGARVWIGIRTDLKGGRLETLGVVATHPRKPASEETPKIGIRFVHDIPELISAIDEMYQWAIVNQFAASPIAVADIAEEIAAGAPAPTPDVVKIDLDESSSDRRQAGGG